MFRKDRSSPTTGHKLTPGPPKPSKIPLPCGRPTSSCSSKHQLFGTGLAADRSSVRWSTEEESCLVKFVFISGYTNSWPTTKAKGFEGFWESAAKTLRQQGYNRAGEHQNVKVAIYY